MSLPWLFDLLSIPTAPFREQFIAQFLERTLMAAKVPHFRDASGNLVVGAGDPRSYRAKLRAATAREPLRFFIAHMDHPGFHGVSAINRNAFHAKWLGGSPTAGLRGAKVWVADKAGRVVYGRIVRAKLTAAKRAIDHLDVRLDGALSSPVEELFGGVAFRKPVWARGKMIYTKAADDLIGVYSILRVAVDLQKKKSPLRHRFIGLITRAEEVGCIGAIAHFEREFKAGSRLPHVLAVSLEASRTLPGADIGRGPVVRLGDRTTVFDSGALRVFSEAAARALPGKHQRRIMDGGSCEGSMAVAFGLTTVGISVPLGNYHNQNFQGGPDSGPPLGCAPEFVHEQDLLGQIALCHALLAPGLGWNTPWKSFAARKKNLQTYKKWL